MLREPFDTGIADDGARLFGPWRSPRQMRVGVYQMRLPRWAA